jgi:hypothetical protein
MKDHTTNPSARKTPNDLVLRWLNILRSKIFQVGNRHAHNHGWAISPRRGGLTRSCRDPRFNYLTSCQWRLWRPDSASVGWWSAWRSF